MRLEAVPTIPVAFELCADQDKSCPRSNFAAAIYTIHGEDDALPERVPDVAAQQRLPVPHRFSA